MIKHHDTPNYQPLPIPMKDDILHTIDTHRQNMIDIHNKVFVMRLDVHAKDNAEFSQFNQRLIQSEKRAGIDAAYVAVAEKAAPDDLHFHEVLFLDGNKTQSIFPHVQRATKIMNLLRGLPEDYNNGLIDDCNTLPNGIMIRRNDSDPTNLQDVGRQCSYLAKEAQKEGFEPGTRKVFASQLKSRKKDSSK